MTTYRLFFDGSCEPRNPGGIATYAYAIYEGDSPPPFSTAAIVIGEGAGMTNNLAEYTGMIEGLNGLASRVRGGDCVLVMGDSQLVIRQMTGQYAVRSPNIIILYRQATEAVKKLIAKGVRVIFSWLAREENVVTDKLSHDAFVVYCKEKGYDYYPCTCGGTLIPRINRRSGGKFYWCSRYPRCKNTKEE